MNHEILFRGLLIKLQDELSESDRHRLHFLFGSIIPRKLRDDPSIGGTLNLLEVLFDRGLINDHDFDSLIQAFVEIQRYDIVKRLKEHTQELQRRKSVVQSKISEQGIDDTEEDKIRTVEFTSICTNNESNVNIDETCIQFVPPSNVSDQIKRDYHVTEQTMKFNFRSTLKKWIYCRKTLIVFNIISMMMIIGLLVVNIIRPQSLGEHSSVPNEVNTISMPPVILGYFAAWSTRRNYSVSQIPADKLTHINYAAATIDSNQHIALADPTIDINITLDDDKMGKPFSGNFRQLIDLKNKYPQLRTLISIGGDNYSEEFQAVISIEERRSTFAKSCVKFLDKYGFDGIDIDWRNPMLDSRSNQGADAKHKQEDLGRLLEEFRRQFDQIKNKTYLLTLATRASPYHLAMMDLSSIATHVDWINVLTYDFYDKQNSRTGYNAPLYKNDREVTFKDPSSPLRPKLNCDAAIQAYIAGGVPSQKIVMGIPLYGIGWNVSNNNISDGFLQVTQRNPPAGTWEPFFFDYDHLKKDYLTTHTQFWDDQSKVPYLYNQTTGIWISYDNSISTIHKTDYIKTNRLRGAFFWELSKDRQAELVNLTSIILTANAY